MKIDSVTDESIETDIGNRAASFKVASTVDFKSKLAELAKTNSHLKDFEISQ